MSFALSGHQILPFLPLLRTAVLDVLLELEEKDVKYRVPSIAGHFVDRRRTKVESDNAISTKKRKRKGKSRWKSDRPTVVVDGRLYHFVRCRRRPNFHYRSIWSIRFVSEKREGAVGKSEGARETKREDLHDMITLAFNVAFIFLLVPSSPFFLSLFLFLSLFYYTAHTYRNSGDVDERTFAFSSIFFLALLDSACGQSIGKRPDLSRSPGVVISASQPKRGKKKRKKESKKWRKDMKGVTDSVIGGRQQWGATQGPGILFAAPLSCMPIHHRDGPHVCPKWRARPAGFSSNWWGIAATAQALKKYIHRVEGEGPGLFNPWRYCSPFHHVGRAEGTTGTWPSQEDKSIR